MKGQKTPYPLRKLIIQHHIEGKSRIFISEALKVSKSVVSRVLIQYSRYGCTFETPRKGYSITTSSLVLSYIKDMLKENPTAYLREVRDSLENDTGVNLSSRVVNDIVHKIGFSFKVVSRMSGVATPESYVNFFDAVRNLPMSAFIFIDETGKKDSDYQRTRGWAPRGDRVRVQAFSRNGSRYNILACLTVDGVPDYFMTTQNFDAALFHTAIQDMVVPLLNPFPQENSVVILDNARFHQNQEIENLIHSVGAKVVFLPTYACPLMPIELVFGIVKRYFKSPQARLNMSAESVVSEAFSLISPGLAQKIILSCGYEE